MLFLPAAALCCLCSALLTMAAQLIQDQLSQTGRAGETVSISCVGTDLCSKNYVHWYQKKDSKTFTVILTVNINNGNIYSDLNQNIFSAIRKQNSCELIVAKISPTHSASYYCSCHKSAPHKFRFAVNQNIFFPLCRHTYLIPQRCCDISECACRADAAELLLTVCLCCCHTADKPTVKPEVTVYSGASDAQRGGKSALLCQASGMFPPLVRFSWKRQKKNGPPEELPPGEQLEIKESGRVTAIRVLEHGDIYSYKYYCYVNHEGNMAEEKPREIELPEPPPPPPPPPHWFKERLLCLMYTLLIGKSLVYFCGLSLVSIVRNKKLSGSSPD
ncbi:uncharacterized protein LOC115796276 [Archocentrus centrarchus]|uniref:uncharacterized protein LOC115796276 n=1 Tax=Archocentrus centrarchus TaxID=63155 RepID=UPI0011E9E463|nr:uncharacterized protein LOC115796276 [Archocentrus centrarchus]